MTKKLYSSARIHEIAAPEYFPAWIKNSNTIHYGQGVPANGVVCRAQKYTYRAILFRDANYRVCCECLQIIFKRRSRGKNTRNTADAQASAR